LVKVFPLKVVKLGNNW